MSFLERCPSYSELKAVADPWEGPGGVSLDPIEARRAEKNLGGGDRPPPLYLRVWMTPLPPPPVISRSGPGTEKMTVKNGRDQPLVSVLQRCPLRESGLSY